jgi:MraZ protein
MRHLIQGEHLCSLDERFRISFPQELLGQLAKEPTGCVLVKERKGCLSLWNGDAWTAKYEARVKLVEAKLQAETFGEERLAQVQMLGRLLSSRHRNVDLRGRRLLIPEGFREFLGVDRDPPGNEVVAVGAAVCIEIWKPAAWLAYLERRMPHFRKLFNDLSS